MHPWRVTGCHCSGYAHEKLAFRIKPTIKLPQGRLEAHGVEKMKNMCRVDGREVGEFEIDVGKSTEPHLETPALLCGHLLHEAVERRRVWVDRHHVAAACEQRPGGDSIPAADVERRGRCTLRPDDELQRERIEHWAHRRPDLDGRGATGEVLVNGVSVIAHGISPGPTRP